MKFIFEPQIDSSSSSPLSNSLPEIPRLILEPLAEQFKPPFRTHYQHFKIIFEPHKGSSKFFKSRSDSSKIIFELLNGSLSSIFEPLTEISDISKFTYRHLKIIFETITGSSSSFANPFWQFKFFFEPSSNVKVHFLNLQPAIQSSFLNPLPEVQINFRTSHVKFILNPVPAVQDNSQTP